MIDHDVERLTAFLAGELSLAEAEAVDAHLLDCQSCWRAVYEDTVGRRAAESLREVAPAEVRDRVRLAVVLAPAERSGRPRWRMIAATLVLFATLSAALFTWSMWHTTHGRADDLALIVRQVRVSAEHHAPPTWTELAGRRFRIESYEVDGGRVVVAYGTEPFPMPNDAHMTNDQVNGPWSAPVDGLNVLCFNEPRPALLVGDKSVSATALSAFAHRLALS